MYHALTKARVVGRFLTPLHVRCFSQEAIFTETHRDAVCKELGISPERIALTKAEIRKLVSGAGTVGMVPTMGALHAGHISLVDKSTQQNDITVSSIFVNAGQFAPHEDFGKYPRQPVDDIKAMFKQGVDYIFIPSQSEMYPGSTFGQTSTSVCRTHVVPFGVDEVSEGAARPGFFRGVATVVAKLFNIVQPTNAYFGQKDGLQVLVIRQMVRDLNFPVNVIPCPTLRESDGLAMSSRNVYLSKEQRAVAPKLYAALCAIEAAFKNGERSYDALKSVGLDMLDEESLFHTEYLSICDSVDAMELDEVDKLPEVNIMVSAAVNFGDCRILDNVLLGDQV